MISEAHRNLMRVRCVPFAASRDALFSVSFRENRHSDLIFQRLESADSVEKLRIFQPGKAICVLSFLSVLTHGGDHIYCDLFVQRHC